MKNDSSLSLSLLSEVIEGRGSLALQRLLQQQRLAHPGRSMENHLSIHKNAEKSKRGQSLKGDLQQNGIEWTAQHDAGFPLLLQQLNDPPVGLFHRGDLTALQHPCVAIVGARTCSSYGEGVARMLASELSRNGFTIVSGLALGIDATAHQAALDVGGKTVAFLGTGVDLIYPNAHRQLATQICSQGGAMISEFAPGTRGKPFHFPIRNRLISGSCLATIVVEAEIKSGSLITARHALDQGRELFAVPGPIDKSSSAGTNYLIQSGAAQLLSSVEDVLETLVPLGSQPYLSSPPKSVCIGDQVAERIYQGLDALDPRPLEFIVAESELPTSEVMAKLIHLESLNLVIKKPGPVYVRNPAHSQS
jgi:DNA processing protein